MCRCIPAFASRGVLVPVVFGCLVSAGVLGMLWPPVASAAAVVETTTPDRGEPFRLAAPGTARDVGGTPPRTGWPVDLNAPGAGFPYTPTLFDVDHDGADEIFVTGGQTFGLRGDGSFLPGWPTTEHTYMGYGTNEQKPGPAAADLEDDGDVEVMWSERDWWAGGSYMWCFNGRESSGANMPGFPQYAPDDYSNALEVPFVLGDSDEDGYLEAWGPHTLGNNGIHYRVSAFDHLGTRLFTRDVDPTENILDLYFGDLDGNGHDEFFAVAWHDPTMRLYVFTPSGGDAPGSPLDLITLSGGYPCFGPPIPVDLDGDGELEFLIGYNAGTISRAYAVHRDGTPVSGFPLQIGTSSQLLYLGLGDLTGDGQPELIALDNHLSGANRAYAFSLPSGALLAGWPYPVASWPHGFPCVVDVDGDGFQDVCISNDGGEVLAISHDGTLLPGFPKSMAGSSISGVAAGDIDGDGLFELVSSTWDGLIYAWDTDGPALAGRADWPMRGVDARYSGIYRSADVTGLAGVCLPSAGLRLEPNPSPGPTRIEFGSAADGMRRIEIHDVRGRILRVFDGPARGAVAWDGRDGSGHLVPAGTYLVRSVASDGIRTGRLIVVR